MNESRRAGPGAHGCSSEAPTTAVRALPRTLPAVGRATYSLQSVTQDCFNSLKGQRYPTDVPVTPSPPPASDDGGGTPSWVWAVVGSVLGCAALTAVAAAFLLHRWRCRRRAAARAAAAASSKLDPNGHVAESPFASVANLPSAEGSMQDLPALAHGRGASGEPWSHPGTDSGGAPPRQLTGGSGDLQTQLMRARCAACMGLARAAGQQPCSQAAAWGSLARFAWPAARPPAHPPNWLACRPASPAHPAGLGPLTA